MEDYVSLKRKVERLKAESAKNLQEQTKRKQQNLEQIMRLKEQNESLTAEIQFKTA